MIEHLVMDEEPNLREPTMIAAFAGWPDAGEVASGSMRYLLRKLRAKKFAAIDPEIFYTFTEVRPHTALVGPYQREIRWPSNEFHYWRGADDLDLLLFLGREPNLRWKTYVGALLALAEQCQVKRLITLGGTFDSVPHTGEPRVSGTAMDASFRGALEGLAVRSSSYQGPTSIHSALLDACRQRGLASGSLWGHAPHYLQAAPNVKVCYGMLRKLSELLDLPVDLEEIRGAAHALELRVDRLLADNSELQEYVRQLEASEERSAEPPAPRGELPEIPSPEAVVQDVEEFFRQEQQRRREEGDAPPP